MLSSEAKAIPRGGVAFSLLRRPSDAVAGGLGMLTGSGLVTRRVEQDQWTVAPSPDGNQIATTGSDGGVYVWAAPPKDERDSLFGRPLVRLQRTGLTTHQQAFSPDAQFVVSYSGDFVGPGRTHVFSTRDGLELWSVPGPIRTALVSPDSRLLALTGLDQISTIYEFSTGRRKISTPGWALAFSPDMRRLLVGRATAGGFSLFTVDVATGATSHGALVSSQILTSGAISPDGRWFAAGGEDHGVRIVDAKTGKVIHAMFGHTNQTTLMQFLPDSRRILSAGFDGTVRVWDAVLGKPLRVLDNSNFVSSQVLQAEVLSDGRRLAVTSVGAMNIWDLETGRLLLEIPRKPDQTVIHVLTSGDMLSVGSSGQIYQIDAIHSEVVRAH